MCFERVLWGTGLRPHYVETMVVLRRLISDFIRIFVMKTYDLKIPDEFIINNYQKQLIQKSIHNNNDNNKDNDSFAFLRYTLHNSQMLLKKDDGSPLKILLISRGIVGTGRSLANEKIILKRLELAGAMVKFCCKDFEKIDLETQICMAVHSDVVCIYII